MKNFSATEALNYAKRGLIEDWIHEFLTTSGKNEGFSTGLKKEKRFFVGPRKINLDELQRICGPEKNIKFHESQERWENRVQRILSGLKRGWEMPPLIVMYKRGKLSIADGNHRYEALKRRRFKKYWTIIWYDSIKEVVKHNKMKPAVFFITGTSGSGKSTLVDYLKRDLSFAEIHDFDEGGVPEGADENWRKQRTNEWLEKAKAYQRKGKSTIVCGVSVPAEVKNSPAYDRSLNVHYGIIHIDESEIRRRLKSRGWKGNQVEDNVNWAEHLERYVKAEKEHYIVDGVANKPHQVAEKFIDWIVRETTD